MRLALPAHRREPSADHGNPWLRYGWLLAGAWVCLLAFPLVKAVTAPAPLGLRVLGVVLVLIFAAIYLRAFRSVPLWLGHGHNHRVPWRGLLVLALIAVALIPVIGLGAVGLLPFLAAYASYLLPQPWPSATFAVGTAVAGWLSVAERDWALTASMLLISTAILASAIVTRTLINRETARDALERESLVVTERDRLARDVHDLLGHSLTVINLKSQLATRLIDVDPARVRAELASIADISQEALAGVRHTVSGRRSIGFAHSVDEFVATLGGAGVTTTVSGDPGQVSGSIVLPLVWVMRELSTNVLRHAHAENCVVELSPGRLVVSDDGDGFHGSREGHGIRGMKDRLALVGATLRTGVSPLGGARVEVTW